MCLEQYTATRLLYVVEKRGSSSSSSSSVEALRGKSINPGMVIHFLSKLGLRDGWAGEKWTAVGRDVQIDNATSECR